MNRSEELDRVLEILRLDADSEDVNVHLRTDHSLVEFGFVITHEEMVELMEFLGPDSAAEIGTFGDSMLQLQWSSSDPDIYSESDHDDARHSALRKKRDEETRAVLGILGVAEADVRVCHVTNENEVHLDFVRGMRSFTGDTLKNLAAFLGHEDFSDAPFDFRYRPVTACPWGSAGTPEEADAEEPLTRREETRAVMDILELAEGEVDVTHVGATVYVKYRYGFHFTYATFKELAECLGHEDFSVNRDHVKYVTHTKWEPAEENSATARAVETRRVLDAMGLGGPGQPKHVVDHLMGSVRVVFYSGIVGSVLTEVAKVLGHENFIVDPLGDSKTALTWATDTLGEPTS